MYMITNIRYLSRRTAVFEIRHHNTNGFLLEHRAAMGTQNNTTVYHQVTSNGHIFENNPFQTSPHTIYCRWVYSPIPISGQQNTTNEPRWGFAGEICWLKNPLTLDTSCYIMLYPPSQNLKPSYVRQLSHVKSAINPLKSGSFRG